MIKSHLYLGMGALREGTGLLLPGDHRLNGPKEKKRKKLTSIFLSIALGLNGTSTPYKWSVWLGHLLQSHGMCENSYHGINILLVFCSN